MAKYRCSPINDEYRTPSCLLKQIRRARRIVAVKRGSHYTQNVVVDAITTPRSEAVGYLTLSGDDE